MKLSLGYITGRLEPRLDWFLDSLSMQMRPDDEFEIIVVDALHTSRPTEFYDVKSPCPIRFIPVKPNVWQGKHRLTQCDWYALSNARNTFVASAKHDWLATLDDRMVLCPGWLEAVRDAQAGNYGVAGTYKKVSNLKVTLGQATPFASPPRESIVNNERGHATDGIDHRLSIVGYQGRHPCKGEWWFGGSFSEALEWSLQINGHCEDADGLGLNDVIYGIMLERNGIPLKYDTRMAIIEDRTPGHSGPDYMRTDKGKSPRDKSHALLDRIRGLKRCNNPFGELVTLRDSIQSGGEFPVILEPQVDWYDGQALKDFETPGWAK